MNIPIRKIFIFLLFAELSLLIAYFFPEKWSGVIYNRVNLDLESNIPSWFSTIELFSIAIVAFVIHFLNKDKNSGKRFSSFWLVFSIVYCFLSIDEGARIHEMCMDSKFHFKWIYLYAPLSVTFFLYCAYFFIYVNKNKTLNYWIIGGMIVYAAGAIGCETIYFFIYQGKMEVFFEEGGEMLGSILVLIGCLKELERRHNLAFVPRLTE